jgi:hypothetical protein
MSARHTYASLITGYLGDKEGLDHKSRVHCPSALWTKYCSLIVEPRPRLRELVKNEAASRGSSLY